MYHPSRHTFSTKAFAQFLCVLSTALFFCLFPPGLSAQFSLGPTAGMAATGFRWPSDIRTNPASSPRPKFGLVGGIALELDVSKSTAIHADILFSQKGGKLVSNVTNAVDGDTRYESTITLNYAELPILFRIYTPAKPIQFFAGAGLGASFGLFGRDEIAIHYEKDGVGPVTDIAFRNVDYRDVYKRWDFAAVIEAGFKREAGQGVFSLGLRWTGGLMGIINQTGSQTSEIDQLMNKSLAMTMGYRIYLF